ncbi:MAG: hypothetical protein WC604_03130 [Candidatus Gracilibacteria bacterium]
MDTIQNIKKVSILFFIIIGTLHIGSTLFISNGLYLKQALIINKTLDIPFIITGLIYGLSSLRLSLAQEQKSHTILDTVLAGAIIAIFLGLIAVNLLVPDLY